MHLKIWHQVKEYRLRIIVFLSLTVIIFGGGVLLGNSQKSLPIEIADSDDETRFFLRIDSVSNGQISGLVPAMASVSTASRAAKIDDSGAFSLEIGDLPQPHIIAAYNENFEIELQLSASATNYAENDIICQSSEPSQVNSEDGKFVASKSGKKYHPLDCHFADRIKLENRIWFSTRDEAEAAGYEPSSCFK